MLEVERPARGGGKGRVQVGRARRRARCPAAARRGGGGASTWRGARALSALLATREGAVSACTAALNELRAALVTCPPELRERLQGLPEGALLAACARLGPGARRSAAPTPSPCARLPGACVRCGPRPRRSSGSWPAGCDRSRPRSLPAAAWAVCAARLLCAWSSPGACARRRPSPGWPASLPSPRARGRSASATASTAAATGA